MEPAVQKMFFNLDTGYVNPENPNITHYFLDISQCASIMNRRAYRQGLQWAVAGMKIYDVDSSTYFVNKLPETWMFGNGWEKVFRAWDRQQREALQDGDQEGVRARFNDFKIFASKEHLANGIARNLLPVDGTGNTKALPGEWEASQIVIPNFGAPGVNYEPYITGVGPNVGGIGGAYSIIQLYEDSRATPQSPDPSVPADVTNNNNILNLLFDVGDNNQDVMQNAVGKNDELPYLQEEYPGGVTQLPALERHAIGFVTPSTVGGRTGFDGGVFPCGLIEIIRKTPSPSSTTPALELVLMPGPHRGYMAETMLEM